MIIVLGIVAHFCRQRHHQWHKRQSCFSFDTSLVKLGRNTYKSYFILFWLKTEFCNHFDMSVVSTYYTYLPLCQHAKFGSISAIYNVFLIEYSVRGKNKTYFMCVVVIEMLRSGLLEKFPVRPTIMVK